MSLIELMIVVAIIGILTAVAVPKMGAMIQKSNESSTLKKLGAIRAALSIYYADNEGIYPYTLDPLETPGSKYLTGMYPLYTKQHGNVSTGNLSTTIDADADTGEWGYVTTGADWGHIWVACTHTDSMGRIWSSF